MAYNITVIIAMIIIMVSDVGMDSSASYLYLIRRVLLSPAQKGAEVETFIWSAAIIDSREIGIIAVKSRRCVPQHIAYFLYLKMRGSDNNILS